ncbi:MAG: MFS transporter [Deltaproteobacteria bacterium]|nr:MFS transporter [Deltaproteobacteria bacterium]
MSADDRKRNERRVLAATCFAHGMTHLYMLVFPALVTPLRQELGLDLGEALELAFLGYLLYGLGSLPAGIIADRWSARWMLTLCLALSGAGAVLAGLSHSPTTLVMALGVLGIGASIYHPTGMALISRAFHDRRGRALGLNGVFGNIGLASAPFVTGLLTSMLGWRWAYGALGAMGLAGSLWVATMPIDDSVVEPDAAGSARAGTADAGHLKRYFLVLCVAMMLAGLAYRSASLVMPSYFELKASFLVPTATAIVEAFGGTGAKTAAATALTSLVYATGIVGQMLGGRVADSRDLRLSYLCFHLLAIPPVIAMVWLAEVPLLLAAMLYILFGLGMQPIENSLIAKLTPPAWRSTAYGLKFVLAFGVGSFAVGIVGHIERRAGLPTVFGSIGALELALVLVALSLWLVSRRRLPRISNS